MVSMSPTTSSIEIAARGGLLGGLTRKFLGGESFFMNTFHADEAGEVTLAPPLRGDVLHMEMRNQTIMVTSGAYLACSKEISVDTQWGGAKTFFSKEGLFLLRVHGSGDLFLSSFGAIHPKDLRNGETYIVDTGHMVAFDENVNYRVTRGRGPEVDPVQRRGPRLRAHRSRQDLPPVEKRRRLSHMASPPYPEAQLTQAPEQQAKADDVYHRRREPAQEIAQPPVADPAHQDHRRHDCKQGNDVQQRNRRDVDLQQFLV